KSRDTFQYPPHRAKTQQQATLAGPAVGYDRNNVRLPYFIGIRQTKSQYENPIKPSINRTENQFNALSSACWFGALLQEWPPQASQYPSSSFAMVRHSQHCFDISRIMPEASQVSYPQKRKKL